MPERRVLPLHEQSQDKLAEVRLSPHPSALVKDAQRWSLEVVFKEAKGLLRLGKCQAGNFASQIVATSLTALQYNILSLVKRFAAYETMGKLFEDVTKDSLELSVAERIWGVMQELVIAVAELFGLTDEDIYQAIINREEDMNIFATFID